MIKRVLCVLATIILAEVDFWGLQVVKIHLLIVTRFIGLNKKSNSRIQVIFKNFGSKEHDIGSITELLKKDPTTQIKAKTLKQFRVLKDNKFIDNEIFHLKPTDLPVPIFYDQPKMHKPGVPIHPIVHIVAPRCTILTNT